MMRALLVQKANAGTQVQKSSGRRACMMVCDSDAFVADEGSEFIFIILAYT
jgi:hypothetical protein